MNRYITDTHCLPAYLMYPRVLLGYRLNLTELRVYLLLLDRSRLSAGKPGWRDGLGQVYVIYPIEDLAAALGCSGAAVKRALNGLERLDLIERIRRGQGRPNLIFVKLPEEEAAYPPADPGAGLPEGTEESLREGTDATPSDGTEESLREGTEATPSEGTEMRLPGVRGRTPNKNDHRKNHSERIRESEGGKPGPAFLPSENGFFSGGEGRAGLNTSRRWS